MPHAQTDLFGAGPSYPEGFRYEDDVIDERTEATLLDAIRTLPFREFEFHGYTGRRRVVSFGWHYDFGEEQLERASDIPSFLLELREAAARFAGLAPAALPHVLVTEYGPGAAIGWHRDKGVFDAIVGISLAAPCTFRLRRRREDGWERVSLTAAPRSAYLLSGPARSEWEHSIPAVAATRYSVTFRSLRER